MFLKLSKFEVSSSLIRMATTGVDLLCRMCFELCKLQTLQTSWELIFLQQASRCLWFEATLEFADTDAGYRSRPVTAHARRKN